MKKFLGTIFICSLICFVGACGNTKKAVDENNETSQVSQENESQNTTDIINEARSVASYFYFDNHDANYYDESISENVDGRQWCKITDSRFSTKENAKEFLQTEFSDDLADEILANALDKEFFKEIDGNLYALIGDGGQLVNSSEYSVASQTDNKITYNVVVEYYKDDDEQGNPIFEKKEYTFVREKINDKWVFTQFEYVW